jgi:transcriptional regulator with XRE-family HTH domain
MNALEVICKLLREKEVSGRQFAFTLGFEADAVYRWKTGRSASYVDHIDIIAGYFNMSVAQLIELSDDPRDIVRKFVIRRVRKR